MFKKMYTIMPEADALAIREQIMELPWKEGRARTKELTGTIKQNLELKPQEDGELVTQFSKNICAALNQNMEFQLDAMPQKMTAVKFNNYKEVGTYNRHTDAPWMGNVRTDFAVTVFLSDPDTYEGGVLNIETPEGEVIEVKGRPGQAFVYNCGQPHWVTPVTKGERISAIGWIQSTFPENWQRDILRTVRSISRKCEARMFEDEEIREWFVDLGKVHSGLLRKWTEHKQ